MLPYVKGFQYLATPYSKYIDGLSMASEMACKLAAILIDEGIPVFSPIAHSHAIAMAGGMDPLDHNIWMPADKPLMEAAYGLIVAKLPGWEDSRGVLEEIDAFRAMGKPVHYMEVT